MMYGNMMQNKSPEDEALEEIKELIARIMVQKRSGENMENIEKADEHLETHGDIDELGLEDANSAAEQMVGGEGMEGEGMEAPEFEEEEEGIPNQKRLHLAEISVGEPTPAEKNMLDEEKQKALKMVKAIRKAR